MDTYVKNFIIASIVYLGLASILGLGMLWSPQFMALKFVHSHLNMLGWVSMMIYGVGYHILPRFAGKPVRYPKIGEAQFVLSNVSLVGMLGFYTLNVYVPGTAFLMGAIGFGVVHVLSIGLFFYNMLATLLPQQQA